MKLLVERELFEQCIRLLDELENDNGVIPEYIWKDRNRLLSNAKAIGYEVRNAPNKKEINFKQGF